MARNIVCLLVLILVTWSMQHVAVGQETPTSSGPMPVTATSIAAGIGWTWGSGTLILLDGSQHRWTVRGLDGVAVGIQQATAVGDVSHLQPVKDCEGTYGKAAAGMTGGGGAGAARLQHEQGVVSNLPGVGQGVDVR